MSAEPYTLTDGCLRAHRDPRFNDPQFQAACEGLMRSAGSVLTVDLSEVRYVSSPEIGLLVRLHKQAVQTGRTLKVRVSPSILTILRLMKIEDLLNVEAAPIGEVGSWVTAPPPIPPSGDDPEAPKP